MISQRFYFLLSIVEVKIDKGTLKLSKFKVKIVFLKVFLNYQLWLKLKLEATLDIF